jgi:hypothetical protein
MWRLFTLDEPCHSCGGQGRPPTSGSSLEPWRRMLVRQCEHARRGFVVVHSPLAVGFRCPPLAWGGSLPRHVGCSASKYVWFHLVHVSRMWSGQGWARGWCSVEGSLDRHEAAWDYVFGALYTRDLSSKCSRELYSTGLGQVLMVWQRKRRIQTKAEWDARAVLPRQCLVTYLSNSRLNGHVREVSYPQSPSHLITSSRAPEGD